MLFLLWLFKAFACEAIWPWAFCCWRFSNHSFNVSAYDWSVHIFCFFLVQSWKVVSILFSEFVHFFQVVHFIGIYLLAVVFYDPLYSCGIHCNFCFSISNFVDMNSTPFFLWWVMLMVYLFYLLKEPAFSFIDLCYCFIFALIFMVSFLLLALGFFLLLLFLFF